MAEVLSERSREPSVDETSSINSQFQAWLKRLEVAEESASTELVELFYNRLLGLAKHRLLGTPPQVADDEGAVISALRSFFSGIQGGQFQGIGDEQDLWRVLATITSRKAIRQLRVHWKQSGEGGKVERSYELTRLVSNEPTAEERTELVEECQRCLDALEKPDLKAIALLRLEGCATDEIAQRLQIHVRSVQRKLRLIEAKWMETLSSSDVCDGSNSHAA